MAVHMRMINLEEPEKYTEIFYDNADFGVNLPDRTFTEFSLRSGGN